MIGGIIIDSYTYFRELTEARDEDMNNVCFICGNERNVIDKSSIEPKTFF